MLPSVDKKTVSCNARLLRTTARKCFDGLLEEGGAFSCRLTENDIRALIE
ncbi:MAG: hypothetical protein Q8R39_03935 [bacterium]|nr:hypothetical protein [bacterium]MDZ4284232.1 hypothetical protein [Patescibacteria group bacterium]